MLTYYDYNIYFYSRLSLQKHMVCIKGHQNNPEHQEFYSASCFWIPQFASSIDFEYLCLRVLKEKMAPVLKKYLQGAGISTKSNYILYKNSL